MAAPILLPRPHLGFPTPGWRKRLEEHVGQVESTGIKFEVKLGPRATPKDIARAEGRLGRTLPADLRAFLVEVDGASIGFVTLFSLDRLHEGTENMRAWQTSSPFLPDVPVNDLVGFAYDGADNYYGLRPLDSRARHQVIYFCHDPPGWEHRFTSLGSFVESALVRAHASALWWQAETAAGKAIDDEPWITAARSLELEIDPALLRTRED